MHNTVEKITADVIFTYPLATLYTIFTQITPWEINNIVTTTNYQGIKQGWALFKYKNDRVTIQVVELVGPGIMQGRDLLETRE